MYQYSACSRGISFGTPVVPPESWKTATSSGSMPRWISSTCVRASAGSRSALGEVVEDEDVAHRRVVAGLLVGERDEVDASGAGLDEVRARSDRPADVGDLVAAVGGEGRDRDEPGLEQRVPGDDGVEPVGDLDDDRVAGVQAEVGEPDGDPIGAGVELGVGEPALRGDDGVAVRVAGGGRVELVGDRPGAPEPGVAVGGGDLGREVVAPHRSATRCVRSATRPSARSVRRASGSRDDDERVGAAAEAFGDLEPGEHARAVVAAGQPHAAGDRGAAVHGLLDGRLVA